VLCIGAGGLVSHIAPTLVRKGIGAITFVDDDVVEASNLNRQRFYPSDLGRNKAIALAENLQRECIAATRLTGHAMSFEDAIHRQMDLDCDVAVCGVDNNPTRVLAGRHFRQRGIPVVFTAVSADADHGYVFVQDLTGPCFGCVFPDAIDSKTYPCPGTPAVADILQIVGGLSVYAIDTCVMSRPRHWNYRDVYLSDGAWGNASRLGTRTGCRLCQTPG
jgi:molybdopterin/thiamine biosynthesis adenylyltransferase